MKYCMKCGTLLEDSYEICIGCGSDVTKPGTWSMYPPEMAKSIEIEKKEKKSQLGLIAAMIAVFTLLVAAVTVFIIFNANNKSDTIPEETVMEEEDVQEVKTETTEKVEAEPDLKPLEIEDSSANNETDNANDVENTAEIKDSAGKYYSIGTVSDAAGNEMFTTLYPEDFSEKSVGINYDVYSTRYPESLTYIVVNKDENVKFTYMSPQHYWYRKSDYKSQTRSNERDVENYMQFLTYSGAQGYIEALIKQSYTDIKGFKFIDKEEFDPVVTDKLQEISDNHTKELLGDIGDYAKIGSDTVYAAMQAECEAYIYHYQATSKQNNTIYMDFYVPVMANILGYVSDMNSDKGEVTEWLVPEFFAFETGNEELHSLYEDSFKMFIYNSGLSNEFFYMNHAYAEDIEKAVSMKREPVRLSTEKLKTYHKEYSPSKETNSFSKDVESFLKTMPASCTSFTGDLNIVSNANDKVAFFSKEKNKVFISPEADEYPGSDYVSLEYHEGSDTASLSESSDDSSASAE